MRYASLFSGIGGFDLALDRAGMECVRQVEIDAKCRSILARHWPDVARGTDVCEEGAETIETVGLICGGFPCQDLSVAGRRAGLAGERSGLWWEFHRILAEVRPRWVLIENVPGLLSSNRGWDMGAILGALGSLGYGFAYRVLDAQWFGLAQRRKRVFIVGCLGDVTAAAQVLLEPDGGVGDSPPSRKARTVAPTLSSSGAGTSRTGNERTEADMIVPVAAPLTAGMSSSAGVNPPGRRKEDDVNLVPEVARALSASTGGLSAKEQQATYVPVRKVRRAQSTDDAETWAEADAANTLTPFDTGDVRSTNLAVAHALAAKGQYMDGTVETFVARPLRAEGADASEDGTGRGAPLVGVRRLTPCECERLQGFPDDWTRWGADGAEISDSARYRMLGNAVAVPVVEWIARRIVAFDAQRREATA